MATKDGSVKAVEQICEIIGKDFSEEKLLKWKSLESDEWDANWVVTPLHKEANSQYGLFSRANSSTHFEDAQEREVDLDKLRTSRPKMVECIDECNALYEQILNNPKAQTLLA